MRQPISALLGVAISVAAATLIAAAPASAAATATNGCIASVPDPGTTAPVSICYTLFRPDGASASHRVPMVLHSHGWGGSRSVNATDFTDFLDAGFGVLSFDQRGFGESGGKAQLENPDYEGRDVQKIVDIVAGLDWVAKDKPGDPVLGAIGGSYGGGSQFVGAFSELRDEGKTRFNALAPEITWNSLSDSLFPSGVAKTEWALGLYAAGIPSDANTATVSRALVESAVTGNAPPYLAAFIEKNGPAWHVSQGRKLDIPVLLGQGMPDNLFPLNQALKNFQTALTDKARAKSMVVGYNGGHTLPSILPMGTEDAIKTFNNLQAQSDPCSQELTAGSFRALSLRFMQENLQGKKTGLEGYGLYHLSAAGSDRCVTVSSTQANTSVPLGRVISTAGLGAPVSFRIAAGPLTLAGTPTMDASVTSLALDGRLFLALSVGTTPLDAQIVQNNMLPLHEAKLVVNKWRSGIELPSVAVDVPAGKNLYLTVSPISDMSFGHGSRVPGVFELKKVAVHLPVVQ